MVTIEYSGHRIEVEESKAARALARLRRKVREEQKKRDELCLAAYDAAYAAVGRLASGALHYLGKLTPASALWHRYVAVHDANTYRLTPHPDANDATCIIDEPSVLITDVHANVKFALINDEWSAIGVADKVVAFVPMPDSLVTALEAIE